MNLTVPRLLVASTLTLIATFISGLSFSSRVPSAKASRDVTNSKDYLSARLFLRKRVSAPKPTEINSQHVLAVPLYNVSGGWTSELMLSNQAPRQMQAEITLFSLTGQQLHIPAVTLEAHQAEVYDLTQWASAASFKKGSLQVSYFGPERVVAGAVTVVRANHSLIFDQQLTEPEEYFTSSRLEGLWWLPSTRAQMSVVVSNTSDEPLSANIALYSPQGTQLGSSRIPLTAHETRVLDSKKLIDNEDETLPEVGGIKINHTGEPGSVFASAMIQEPPSGFSAIIDLQDPQAAVSSRLDGAGLRIGQAGGEQLTQVAVARNVGDADSTLSGRVTYTKGDGLTGVIPIHELNLKPGETSSIELAKALREGRVSNVVAAGLEFEYQGPPR